MTKIKFSLKYTLKFKSRQAGHRVGENLQSIIPLIVFYCQCKDEELVEYSLQAFESFVRRCPKEITNYIKEVLIIFIHYCVNIAGGPKLTTFPYRFLVLNLEA